MTEREAIQATIDEKIVPLINDVMDKEKCISWNYTCHLCAKYQFHGCIDCPIAIWGKRCLDQPRWFRKYLEGIKSNDPDLAIGHLLGIQMELEGLWEVADG